MDRIGSETHKEFNYKAAALTFLTIVGAIGYIVNFVLGAFVIPETSVWATITLCIFLAPPAAFVGVFAISLIGFWIIRGVTNVYDFWDGK